MKHLFFLLLLTFLTFISYSQNIQQKSRKLTDFPNKIEGTYQFQMINTRGFPFIPANLDELVQKNRKEKEATYLKLGTMVRLKIFPYSEINKGDFQPVEKITYISE